jgi:hypothetical protein
MSAYYLCFLFVSFHLKIVTVVSVSFSFAHRVETKNSLWVLSMAKFSRPMYTENIQSGDAYASEHGVATSLRIALPLFT